MVIQPGGPSVGGAAADDASTAAIAIPPLSNGANPKWVHVSMIGNNGNAVFIFGQAAVAAATLTNGIGLHSNGPGSIVNVAGNTHYRVFGNGTAAAYTMTPLAGV